MPAQRIYLSLLLILCSFFSCDEKKYQATLLKNNPSPSTPTADLISNEIAPVAESFEGFVKAASQHFSIPGARSSVVRGRNGLELTIDPSKLEKEDGSPIDGKIALSLVELVNSKDLFKANAATISDGRLLVSGGSYFIGMECRGQKLHLKKGATLEVHFPLLKKNEMELFYGERDSTLNMNWKSAGILLQEEEIVPVNGMAESISFMDNSLLTLDNPPLDLNDNTALNTYKTLNDEVYYYNRKLRLSQLVDTINKHGKRVFIDTIYNWPKNLPKDKVLDSNYLAWVYGPRLTYRLKTCSAYLQEKAAAEKRKLWLLKEDENWKTRTLAGQIQRYYAPAAVSRLGWINCDRYYEDKDRINVELELPITMNNSRMEYFIIFKSFNGLINKTLYYSKEKNNYLENLPLGEGITVVAFIKKGGVIYQCKEDFVVRKTGKLSLDFSSISQQELKNIFGGNVKI